MVRADVTETYFASQVDWCRRSWPECRGCIRVLTGETTDVSMKEQDTIIQSRQRRLLTFVDAHDLTSSPGPTANPRR